MSSAARPKRAAEDFARNHHHHDGTPSSSSNKKPRFDARNPSTLAAATADPDEHDIVLDADVIGKSGPQTKRNAVNIDGYESDSDGDNFDERARQRSKKQTTSRDNAGEDEEEEDDMFADVDAENGDDDDEEGQGLRAEANEKERKKDVRFMDAGDVVDGQVMNSVSGGRVSSEILLGAKGKRKGGKGEEEEESESSGDEEERDRLDEEMEDDLAAEIGAGGKKKNAPRLDAFNLKAEEEEGRYDESGNYVRRAADPDAVNDNWLDGLSKKDMKRAKEAQEKREDERRRKIIEDDAVLTSDLLSTLITHLETGESPLEALQRLNKGKSKTKESKVPKWKQKKQKDKMDVEEATANGNGHQETHDAKEERRRQAVEAITGAADALYSRGQHEIYEAERELLMRQYRRETDEDWKPPASNSAKPVDGQGPISSWEYRWSDARDGGETHGPYDGPTMKAWNEAGYFGEGVEFRRLGDGAWSRVLDDS